MDKGGPGPAGFSKQSVVAKDRFRCSETSLRSMSFCFWVDIAKT